jgi:hypothetical protein
MKKDEIKKELAIFNKTISLENPILRYHVKKNNLNENETLILGILLDITDHGKVEVRTHYGTIARQAELPPMDVYQGLNALQRYRIIDFKPSGDFVHISFNRIEEKIDEIELSYINARKIKQLEIFADYVRKQNYTPKDELFDLIYPVAGKIVTRKIAETFNALVNYINERLNSALSFNMWKYRFLSFKSGLPLGEIILRDSLPCIVEELLIISKKSSILIASASRQMDSETDRDIFASMLSAINDFIATSFNKKKNELNEISFGESKIILRESLHFYYAAVVTGSATLEFLESTDHLMNNIHITYRDYLKNFKGSMAGLGGIKDELDKFIGTFNTAAYPGVPGDKSFKKLKIAAASIAVLIIALTALKIKNEISDYMLEKRIAARIDDALPKFTHDIILDVDRSSLTIKGIINSDQTGRAIEKTISEFPDIKTIKNLSVTADFKAVEKFKSELAAFNKKFSDLELISVRQELEKIVIQFPAGVTVIGENQILQARKIYEILKNYRDIHVDVIAFNDPAGGFDVNKRLAEERMSSIRNYLIQLGMYEKRIHLSKFNPDVISADTRYSAFKDLRGIMLFAKQAE